jgi:N12 class adenine-specific DNA methylase
MSKLVPVDGNPFEEEENPKPVAAQLLTPVDFDPFAEEAVASKPSIMDTVTALPKGIYHGITSELPDLAGQALQFVTPKGSILNEAGKNISEAAEERLKSEPLEKVEEGPAYWLYQGGKMLGPSAIPAGALGTFTNILSKVSKVMKLAKAAEVAGDVAKATELMAKADKLRKVSTEVASAGTAALFGLSQAQQTKETALKRADDLEAAGDMAGSAALREKASGAAPLLTGGIEAVGEYLGTKYLSKLLRFNEKAPLDLGQFMRSLGVEIGTEMGQQAGEATVEKFSDIRPDADPLEEAKSVIGPTAVMSLLGAGGGKMSDFVAKKQKESEIKRATEAMSGEQDQGADLTGAGAGAVTQVTQVTPATPEDKAFAEQVLGRTLTDEEWQKVQDKLSESAPASGVKTTSGDQGLADVNKFLNEYEEPITKGAEVTPQKGADISGEQGKNAEKDGQGKEGLLDKQKKEQITIKKPPEEAASDSAAKKAQTKLHSIADDLADGKEAALEDYKVAISQYGKNTVQDVIGNHLNQTTGLTDGYIKLQPQMQAILDETSSSDANDETPKAGPGHPYYYKEGGKPLEVKDIEPAKDVSIFFDKMPKNPKKKEAYLLKRKAEIQQELDGDIAQYTELVEKGDAAVSEYDKKMGYGKETGLYLKHNHISSNKGKLAFIEEELKSIPKSPEPTTGKGEEGARKKKDTAKQKELREKQGKKEETENVSAGWEGQQGEAVVPGEEPQGKESVKANAEETGGTQTEAGGNVQAHEVKPLSKQETLKLRNLKYTIKDISSMTPEQGREIIKAKTKKEKLTTGHGGRKRKEAKQEPVTTETKISEEAKYPEPAAEPETAKVEPDFSFEPQDDWENHLIKARVYAGALKIDFQGMKLEEIVAKIKNVLKEHGAEVPAESKAEAPETVEEEKPTTTGKGEGGARKKGEKKEKKEKAPPANTFTDIGNVWDPYKRTLDSVTGGTTKKDIGKVIAKADRSVVFEIKPPEGATPGTARFAESIRNQFKTFQDYYSSNYMRSYYSRRTSMLDKIRKDIEGNPEDMEKFKEEAAKYMAAMKSVTDVLNGSMNVTQAFDGLQRLFYGSDFVSNVPTEAQDIRRRRSQAASHYTDFGANFRYFEKDYIFAGILFDHDALASLVADENNVVIKEKPIHIRLKNESVVREGLADYRKGKDIDSSEKFNKPFNFSAVAFGDWVEQKELQRLVNAAYDALKDLAKVIGAPDKGMSLGGRLSLQFGNLGTMSTKAAAFYVPGKATINLTKNNGDGTISHEWGHALDDLFSKIGGGTSITNSLKDALSYTIDLEAAEKLASEVLDPKIGYGARWYPDLKGVELAKKVLEERWDSVVKKKTTFYTNASKAGNSQYQTESEEMFSRAFEAFVYDTLGGTDNYLVNDWVSDGFVSPAHGYRALIYPSGEERKTFNGYIQYVLDGIFWKEDGTPELKDGYKSLLETMQEEEEKAKQDLFDRLDDIYRAMFAAPESYDGLYWYAHTVNKFGKMQQPKGYFAFDEEYRATDESGASVEGRGAMAYPEPLHPDMILDYGLKTVAFSEKSDTMVYIKEAEDGRSDELREDVFGALDEISTDDGEGTEEKREPAEGTPAQPGTGENGVDEALTTGGTVRGGPRERPNKVDSPTLGEESTDIEPGSDAIHTASNYKITDPGAIGKRSLDDRFSDNIAAFRVLHQIESKGRTHATDEEKDVLVRFSGWGGLGEVFNPYGSSGWESKREIAKRVLSQDERKQAASSSDTAYFTPSEVYKAMYAALEKMGFKGGKILDPSLGTGNSFGLLPESLSNSVLTGIELEPVTAKIASLLYGKADVRAAGFQDTHLPKNFFDLTISNVPFSNEVLVKYGRISRALHDYFFLQGLDVTRPGGMVAFITSTGVMDKSDDSVRKLIEKNGGELVGALRLPAGIFSATDVVSDILFIRKKIEGAEALDAKWMESKKLAVASQYGYEYQVNVNEYFHDHPDMVLGAIGASKNRWGDKQLTVTEDVNLDAALVEAAGKFPENTYKYEKEVTIATIDDLVPAPGHVREGAYYIGEDGKIYTNKQGLSLPVTTDKVTIDKIKQFIGMNGTIRELLRSQLGDGSDEQLKALQKTLNKQYDAFVKKYGLIYKDENIKAYADDPDVKWIAGLEVVDEDHDTAKKSDIFTKRIIPKYEKPTHEENAVDGLMYALNERGYVDLDYIQQLTGQSRESVLQELEHMVIHDPEGGYVLLDEYTSGNVRAKLKIAQKLAETNHEYDQNVKMLEAVIPEEVGQGKVRVRLGQSWVNPKHITDFVTELMEISDKSKYFKMKVSYSKDTGSWYVKPYKGERYRSSEAEANREFKKAQDSTLATSSWGTKEVNFYKLMDFALNSNLPKVMYEDPADGKRYIDKVATEAAIAKLNAIHDQFEKWVWQDQTREKEITESFNDIFNAHNLRKYDGSHLSFPGKSQVVPAPTPDRPRGFYPHQTNAVWRWITNGNIYLAHEVGTGKTWTMAAIAMEAKRLGLRKKPMIVSLNDSTLRQFEREFIQLYPAANILALRIGAKKEAAKEQLAKIAMNNWDAVIITQASLDRIQLDPNTNATFMQEEIDEFEAGLREAQAEGNKFKERDIQARLKALKEKLKDSLSVREGEVADYITYEQLGVDLLLVDEAHMYKNTPFVTNYGNVKGVDPNRSNTGRFFYYKTRFMNTRYPGGVVLSSGTPLSNSVGELYNIQRYLQPDILKDSGLIRFDSWANNYGHITSVPEYNPAGGGYKMVTKFHKFVNVPSLIRQAFQVLDVVKASEVQVTKDKIGIDRPDLKTGAPIPVVIEQSEFVKEYQKIIEKRAKAIAADPKNVTYGTKPDGSPNPDNILRLISDGKKSVIDPRLIDPSLSEDPQSKMIATANNIMTHYKESEKKKGVQLVFCDLGVPKKFKKSFKIKTAEQIEKLDNDERADYEEELLSFSEGNFSVYDTLKNKLISMGIPAEQIAFIHDANDVNKQKQDKKLAALFRKVRSGEVRVFIGTTQKMGTGVNVQDRVTAMHHLDVWWNYAAYAQRNGRGWRKGNTYKEISIYNYTVAKTVDAFIWDKVASKGRIIDQLLSGNLNMWEIDDISDDTLQAQEMVALTSGNPLEAEKLKLEDAVRKLSYQEAAFNDNKRKLKWTIAEFPGRRKVAEKVIENAKIDSSVLGAVDAVKFHDDKKVYSFKKDGKLIADKLEKIYNSKEAKAIFKEVSKSHIFAQLGKAEEKTAKNEKGEDITTSEFAPLPITVGMRKFNVVGDVVMALSGARTYEKAYAVRNADFDIQILGNLSRSVTTTVTDLEKRIEENERTIADMDKEEPKIEAALAETFPKENELAETEKRLSEVMKQLLIPTGGTAALDFKPEEGAPFSAYRVARTYADELPGVNHWNKNTSESTGTTWYSIRPISISKDPDTIRRSKRKKGMVETKSYAEPISQAIEAFNVPTEDEISSEATPKAFYYRKNYKSVFFNEYTYARAEYYDFIKTVYPDAKFYLYKYDGNGRYDQGNYLIAVENGVKVGAIEAHDIQSSQRDQLPANLFKVIQEETDKGEQISEGDKPVMSRRDLEVFSHAFAPGKFGKEEKALSDRELLDADYDSLDDAQRDRLNALLAPDHPSFSRGKKVSGISEHEVKAEIFKILSTWENGPKIHVAQSTEDLPLDFQAYIKSFKGARDMEGMFDPKSKTIYLIADNLSSTDRAQEVIFHEAIGHFGIRGLLGNELRPILNQVYISKKAEADKIGKQYGIDLSTADGRREAAGEVLARMAERGEKSSFLQKIYAAIRQWLRKMGFSITLSDNDLRVMISQSRQYVDSGQKPLSYSSKAKAAGKIEKVITTSAALGKVESFKVTFPDGSHQNVKTREAAEKLAADKGISDMVFSRKDIAPVISDNPVVEARFKAAKGLPQNTFTERVKQGVERTVHSFTRHFPFLDPKTDGAETDILRNVENIPEYSKRKATKDLADIVGKLRPNQSDVFSRILILDDMLKDIESGLLQGSLPFGYQDEVQVRNDLGKFRAAADRDADTKAALDKRNDYMSNLRSELVSKGLLHESVLKDDRYFHHQVLEYMAMRANGEQYTGLTNTDMRLKKKGWQLARKGSALDFNTDYLQSEFEVVSQAISQLETKKALESLQATADIKDSLKIQAKAQSTNWKSIIPDDYTVWQPEKGNHFYKVHSLTERVLDQLLADINTWNTNKSFDELMEDNEVLKVLAMGGKKEEWVIPSRLAKTLDNFRSFKDEGPVGKTSKYILNTWKQWTLMNPYRVVKYNLNNMSGDLDIAMAYSPKILKYARKAAADLLRDQRNKEISPLLKAELDEAMRKGVISSGITIHEIPDITETGLFNVLTGKDTNLISRIWKTSKDYTNWRENILRLSAYRHFKAEIAAGKNVYGASKVSEIDKISNADDRAAKLARELIGDYGNVSEAGQWVRGHMIPFYSWMEINAPRYFRLIKNLRHEGQGVGRSAGIIGGKMAWSWAMLGVKAIALYAAIALWNSTFWPDEEEELGLQGKRQLHIILGRNEDGAIRTLRFQGALSDALSWFGLENFPQDFEDVVSGKVKWEKKFEEAYKAPIQKLVQGARPLEKTGFEIATGKTLYPDLFKPRPIRDKLEHAFKSISLQMPYRYFTGKPSRGDEVAGFITYQSDPGEAAYYDTLSGIRDFLKENDVEVPEISPTKKSNALYYYKQAKKYGDKEAADKYLSEYLSLGGKKQDLLKSMRKSDPLAFVPLKYRRSYIKSLDAEDRKSLDSARKWWKETYSH